MAPDLLGHVGLTPEVGARIFELMFSASEEDRLAAQPQMRAATTPARQPEFAAWAVPALRAVVDALVDEPGVAGRVGVVGFCFGGTYAFALAAADPRLRAAVPFYGNFPENADPATISCPVLAFYGEDDHGITDGVPELESRMEQAGVDFTARVYHGRRARLLQRHLAVEVQRRGGSRRVGADARLLRRAPDAVSTAAP